MTYAEQHKAALDNMTAVWATKPRPLKKLYGTQGPTPEQLEAWHAAYNAWSSEYRKVCREVARLLPLANAEYHTKHETDNANS